MEANCSYEILVTLNARLVALLLFIVHGKVSSPLDWRDTQLNGLLSKGFGGFLLVIQRFKYFKFDSTYKEQLDQNFQISNYF
jgi:hypothetical protein